MTHSIEAIIAHDLQGIITDWNEGAHKLLGYSDQEMLGTSVLRLLTSRGEADEREVLERVRGGQAVADFETMRQTRDGRVIYVAATISPLRANGGSVIGVSEILRDLTRQKLREAEFAHLSRLYAALREINHVIAFSGTPAELYQKVCGILVQHGGVAMAWIGWHDPATHQIVPLAIGGVDQDYLNNIKVYGDDRPEGRGPTGLAFRTKQPYICNDVQNNPVTLPWRGHLHQRGFEASAGFPIGVAGQVRGVLTVYSREPWFFQEKEITLLAETAADISFALDLFAERAARKQAEQSAENERQLFATIIESMPGILYFYDDQGRFLRWNRNFESVSGYSHAEISRMHPLDFFPPEERQRASARIAEVFEKGESHLEASFLARDGQALPFFFTGRRVVFEGKRCLVGMGIDISERQQADKRLSESERKYRELVQHANSIILRWNCEGRISFLNEFGQRFFGYTAEEIVGRNVMDTIVCETESSGRDLRLLMEQIRSAPKSFEQSVNENTRRDGQRVWISWTNHVVHDDQGKATEILSIGTDITERKRAHEALRRSEEQFRLIMENLADLVAVLDLQGRRLYNSPSYNSLVGEPAALLGSSSFEQIHPDDQERVRKAFAETVRTGAGQRLEYRLLDRTGDARYIESQGSVIRDLNGKISQLIVVSRDVTERREADQVIRDLNANLELRVAERTRELETALVRAEAADRLKSAFLATMSHELRTPLNSIIGFTGILLQGLAGPLNPEQSKQLGMVRSSARHLLDLINDVLDLSKIEAGELELRAEAFNLREALERVVALVKPLAEKKHLSLELTCVPDPCELLSDRRRIEQVLLNLLNNAIKFTEEGRVTITCETIPSFQSRHHESPSGPAICVRVIDTGIGIRPEDLQTLFKPFRQIDSGLARQHDGTGLGLAICHRLATLLGGEISVRSEWTKGSEFSVIIPLQINSAHETSSNFAH